ncbi:two-component sensor histidine kinase [Streptosporangium nondiastaticum]|uniref:histidine kinase n=1 Tax=Streptosporangium nondiastaticum TaxID=35764 RepID=A0A9X7PFB5_9ACTN|nr:histidine kinase [Streptosporangium nondiastaticum]PSJ25732.1 two-component sensor histidine kinase [Streptosporangium nondiastaticum]
MIKSVRRRDAVLTTAVALAGCTALGATALSRGGLTRPYGAPSAIAALTLLLWALAGWPRSRERLAVPLALAGAASLLTTAIARPPAMSEDSWARLAETVTLLVLLVVVVRWAPLRRAAAAVAVAGPAVAAWTLPLLPAPSLLSLAGAAAFWTLPVLGACVIGGYPRLMEHGRTRLVAETRRAQQLSLARDLHDYVAHDVSGIVAQAQAARFVAGTDPRQALAALERIETAGLNALAAMDRMVRTLHEADGSDTVRTGGSGATGSEAAIVEPLPGVDQLPALVERFSSAATGQITRLTVQPGATDDLSRAVGSTAYRVVVEALTNVRRHAPGALRVDVALTRTRTDDDEPALHVTVVNSAAAKDNTRTAIRRERNEHGGRGLSGMYERVRATGGTLVYGPRDGGWQVAATLPPAPTDPAPHAAPLPGPRPATTENPS